MGFVDFGVGSDGVGALKIFVEPCVAIVRRLEASRVRERWMWSFERRPPPYVRRKRRGTVDGRFGVTGFEVVDESSFDLAGF